VLEVVRNTAALQRLAPLWDKLVDQMASRSPFLRWDYVWSWWQHFGEKYHLAVGVLRDGDGEVVAIAPLMIGRDRTRAHGLLRCLSWIGGLGVDGERMDFIVAEGREAELMPELIRVIDALAGEYEMIWLGKVPEDSPALPWVLSAMEDRGMAFSVPERLGCQYLDLPADWAAYEKLQSSRWRRNLRNRWGSFSEDLGGTAGLAGSDLPVEKAWSGLIRLHALQFAGGSSNFLRPKALAFHRDVALSLLASGRAVLPYLTVNGQMVAAAYGFLERGTFMLYQQGWDPELAKLSIGNLGIYQSLLTCFDQKVQVYDMLPGDYRYKAEWCPQRRYLVSLEAYATESMLAAGYRLARKVDRLFRRDSSDSVLPMESVIAR
jgi:CelD/BcsL family acetyltransferase involved in cellulose biosynthesis